MSSAGNGDQEVFFSMAEVDFDDDASIDAFAEQVWRVASAQMTGDDMRSMERAPVMLTERYAAAVHYAAEAHGDQTRKGTSTTYMCHLLGVSSLVLEAGGTEDEAIAGLLHDTVEDAGGLERERDVRTRFGDTVADIVLACSDSHDEDWKRRTPYWDRKQAYLDHLEHEADERAVLVSIADKVHNARATVTDIRHSGPEVLSKFNGTPDDVVRYYSELLRIARARGVSEVLVIPLADAVDVIMTTVGNDT